MLTQEQLAQAILELKNSNLELKASQEKTDAKMRETQESLKRIGRMVGNISNNQGDIAEEFFWNSISSNPIINGIKYENLKKLYPEYKDYSHHLGLASFNMNDVKELASKNNVILLQRKGDIIETILPL